MSNIPKIPNARTRQIQAWEVHEEIMNKARANRYRKKWEDVRDGL